MSIGLQTGDHPSRAGDPHSTFCYPSKPQIAKPASLFARAFNGNESNSEVIPIVIVATAPVFPHE